MIKSITFENYKAFKNGEIEIKPITVLLGANSVGKSAIMQLLLLLQQTNKVGIKSYRSALKLYGGAINLGDAKNIFRNNLTNIPLKIGLVFSSKSLFQDLKEDLIDELKNSFYELGRYVMISSKSKTGLDRFYYKNKKSNIPFDEFLKALKKNTNKFSVTNNKGTYLKNFFTFALGRDSPINLSNLDSETNEEILATLKFLTSISNEISNEIFKMEFTIVFENDSLLIKTIQISNKEKEILKLDSLLSENKSKFVVTSSCFDFEMYPKKYFTDFLDLFNSSNTIFKSMQYENKTPKSKVSFFSQKLQQIFGMFQHEIGVSFDEDQINYVSPLRAHPKRYYMLDKANLNISLDTLDGDALAEVLKEDTGLKTKVNKWLRGFGLNANVEIFKEVIHKLKIEQNKLSLDITDVGFGISQVLPVIIQGFLSKDKTITVIEQPEIHLHPKMQADLADLFIDIIKEGNKKRLLIETHSEYFLKRLRRRIAENKIDYRDVVIYLIEPNEQDGSSKIEDLDLKPGGYFNYPKDYYGGELLRDATEFIKLNISK